MSSEDKSMVEHKSYSKYVLSAVCIVALLMAVSVVSYQDGYSMGYVESDAIEAYDEVNVKIVRDGVVIYDETQHNLITTAGVDWISRAIGGAAGAAPGAQYIALTNDTTACGVGNTTLANEITGAGGLARALGTYAHTNGTATYTIQKQFTATATFGAVQKSALFTAAAAGVELACNTFSSANLINGDQITVTWTITIS